MITLPEFYCSIKEPNEQWMYPMPVSAVSQEAAAGKYIRMLVEDGHNIINDKHEVYVSGDPATIFLVSVSISTLILSEQDTHEQLG